MVVSRRTLEIKDQLMDELKNINETKGVYVIVSEPDEYNITNKELLKHLTKKLNGLYITLNLSCKEITERLDSYGVDVKKFLFIDGTGGKDIHHNCILLKNIGSLTEISLAITNVINKSKTGFLFLDSINTLLMYNELKATEKFCHFLINKLRGLNIIGIFVSVKNNELVELLPIITQFCDKCVIIAD